MTTFLNNKKIPCITPHFHENKFLTVVKLKAKLFNTIFAKQCTLLSNNSVLPQSLPKLTNKSLGLINFSSSDILMSQVDPNKAHGHDMLSTNANVKNLREFNLQNLSDI